ncbi:MAG: J domain-containing protein [Actinomycetes bacterium]
MHPSAEDEAASVAEATKDHEVILSWLFHRHYSVRIREFTARIEVLERLVQSPAFSDQIWSDLQSKIHQRDLMVALSILKARPPFRYQTLQRIWDENLVRLAGALTPEAAAKLAATNLNEQRSAKKAVAAGERAGLECYSAQQMAQMIDEFEPGRWKPRAHSRTAPPPGGGSSREDPLRNPSAPRIPPGAHYVTLGLEAAATTEQIKARYRELVLRYHPDRNPGADHGALSQKMTAIAIAYEVLSDPVQRAAYDQSLFRPSPQPRQPPTPRPPPGHVCMICGQEPVADVILRSEVGMIFVRQRSQIAGPFCRHCGIAMFRVVQNRTMITGWWGIISFFTNIGSILANIGAYIDLRTLPLPTNNDHRYNTPLRSSMPVGRPLLARSGIWVAVVAMAIVVAIIIGRNTPQAGSAASAPSSAPAAASSPGYDAAPPPDTSPVEDPYTVGNCLSISGDSITGVVSCSGPHDVSTRRLSQFLVDLR